MLTHVTALGIELHVNDASAAEVARVESWLDDLDDHTRDTLEELVRDVIANAPVGVTLLYEDEAGAHVILQAMSGVVAHREASREEIDRLDTARIKRIGDVSRTSPPRRRSSPRWPVPDDRARAAVKS